MGGEPGTSMTFSPAGTHKKTHLIACGYSLSESWFECWLSRACVCRVRSRTCQAQMSWESQRGSGAARAPCCHDFIQPSRKCFIPITSLSIFSQLDSLPRTFTVPLSAGGMVSCVPWQAGWCVCRGTKKREEKRHLFLPFQHSLPCVGLKAHSILQ